MVLALGLGLGLGLVLGLVPGLVPAPRMNEAMEAAIHVLGVITR